MIPSILSFSAWASALLFISSVGLSESAASEQELHSVDSPTGNMGRPLEWLVDPSEVEAILRRRAPFANQSATQVGPQFAAGSSACENFAVTTVFTGVQPEGDLPAGVVFTSDGSKILIAHTLTQNVVDLDAATRAVLQTIDVSGSPQGVAVSSDGIHVVTANIFEDTASILDLSTGIEIAIVNIGDQPGGVRITPDGLLAAVSNTIDGSISVIDIATATETFRIPGAGFSATISLTPENGVSFVSFTQFEIAADNRTLIFPDFLNDELDFFDLTLGTVNSVASVARPIGVSIAPNGVTAVASHFFPETSCSVIDVATQTITKNINIGFPTFTPITINNSGTQAICSIQNACVVVDLVTNAVSASLNTASVNQLYTTADGQHALAVGFRGSLISFATETIVKDLNNLISCAIGGVSPTGPRAAMVAVNFGEDLLVVNTNGSSGFLEAKVASGPPAEADKTRRVAISADGSFAVTTNILSDNATVLDLTTNLVIGVVPVGDRPSGVAITPDGTKAVVANLDSTFASVIDLGTMTSTSVAISTRAAEVAISPDGQFAYISVVTGDGIWRIDLNSLSTAGPKLLTGNMGSTFVYMFGPASGIALSPDGGTLAVCGSFTNTLDLIDTASWSLTSTVATPTFPFRALFAADSSEVYVTCKDGDQLVRISNAGVASALTGAINSGSDPYQMALSEDGLNLYLARFGDSALGVVDLANFSLTGSVPLSFKPQGLMVRGTCVTVTGGNWSISNGPGGVLFGAEGMVATIDTIAMVVTQLFDSGLPPSELVAGPRGSFGLIPLPHLDGLLRLDFPADGVSSFCFGDNTGSACPCGNTGGTGEGCLNSSASGALLSYSGTPSTTIDSFALTASGLPASTPGLYFQGETVLNAGLGSLFGDGLRCAGAAVTRLAIVTASAGLSSYPDLGDPSISTLGSVSAGDTRIYQLWFRDPAGPCSVGFNLTQALSVDWTN
ncbi:MAG: DNA-binding beta-propeller fold protein YncE [Planctomycetota bacterium]|jgi:DNA-binding beta-propeller fold protein YncE